MPPRVVRLRLLRAADVPKSGVPRGAARADCGMDSTADSAPAPQAELRRPRIRDDRRAASRGGDRGAAGPARRDGPDARSVGTRARASKVARVVHRCRTPLRRRASSSRRSRWSTSSCREPLNMGLMALLVHLAAAGDVAHIRRVGLSARRSRASTRGIFAMPLLPDFYASHQWLREVKRWSAGSTIVAIDFRIPDDEMVLVGHYSEPHLELQVSEAVRVIMDAADARGYEILVSRSIGARDIHRIRGVPQVVGWRYSPDAHGTRPCGCPMCVTPGLPGARKIRDSYQD